MRTECFVCRMSLKQTGRGSGLLWRPDAGYKWRLNASCDTRTAREAMGGGNASQDQVTAAVARRPAHWAAHRA